MKFTTVSVVAALLTTSLTTAQTYTSCNPLTQSSCPADPAFGSSASFDFTKGASSSWTPSGSVTYSSNTGAAFTVAKHGDSPLISSNFYIMFGHVEYVIQAAPGTGIVSSAVMQSDDLDEIDWEFLGGEGATVQTNYFGKGNTQKYDREQTFAAPGTQQGFHTYSIDWTADRIVYQIDGNTVRTLTPSNADPNQYPQTPMMIKIGAWAGGDPSNPQGTIQWAGGTTNFAAGPFTMYCRSISVTDYSTGTQYKYTDQSGNWQSIQAVGGSVGGNEGASASVATSAPSPTITSDSNGPIPFSGTHRETSSFSTPSIWPWVPSSSSTLTDTVPSGWSASAGSTTSPPTVSQTSPPGVSSPPSPSDSSSPPGAETSATSTNPASTNPTSTVATSTPTPTATSTSVAPITPAPGTPSQTTLVTSTSSAPVQPAGSTSGTPSGSSVRAGSSPSTASPAAKTTSAPPAPPSTGAGNQLTSQIMRVVLASFGSAMALLI